MELLTIFSIITVPCLGALGSASKLDGGLRCAQRRKPEVYMRQAPSMRRILSSSTQSEEGRAAPSPAHECALLVSLSLSLWIFAVCCIYLASVPFRLGSWIDFPASFTACGRRCMIRHSQKDPAPTTDEVPRCKGSRNVFVIDKWRSPHHNLKSGAWMSKDEMYKHRDVRIRREQCCLKPSDSTQQ